MNVYAWYCKDVTSNYDTDVFTPLIREIETINQTEYGGHKKSDIAIRIIADHVRPVAFAIGYGQYLPLMAPVKYQAVIGKSEP